MWKAFAVCLIFSVPAAAGDFLIFGGRVFGHADADAVLIKGERIEAVGRAAELEKRLGKNTRRLDAQGGWILPGLHDSHCHLMSGAKMLSQLRISDKMGLGEIERAVADYAESNPDMPWIEGRGWSYEIARGGFPSREVLDRAVPDRPAALESYDGHAYWANTKALEAAGIRAETPDPEGGKILREADGKTPAGGLLDSAMEILEGAFPALEREEKIRMLEISLRHYSEWGFTSVVNITLDEQELELLEELRKKRRLPLRVSVALPLDGDLKYYRRLAKKYKGPFLRFAFLKKFTDGVVESKTAFMLKPYEGTEEAGWPDTPPEKLKDLVLKGNQAGFSVLLHSIGDGAVRLSLDAFEASAKKNPKPGIRNRVEHIEVIHPDDLPRFKALGVTASMQPYHANPFGPEPDDGVWSRNLGAKRLARTFAWKDLAANGAVLAFGSDWPVMSANPLWGMAVAMTRQDQSGEPKEGWNVHQAIRWEEAVRAYTEGAAYAVGREGELGKIEPGYLADLTVLSPEADFSKPATLWNAHAAHVMVSGEPVSPVP